MPAMIDPLKKMRPPQTKCSWNPTGNVKYWTPERCEAEVKDMLGALIKDKWIVFKWTLLLDKAYPTETVREWKTTYPNNEVIISGLNKIDQIIEERVAVWAIKWKLQPAVAMFTLKCNHKWRDPSQIEVTWKDWWPLRTETIDITNMTSSQRLEYIKSKCK